MPKLLYPDHTSFTTPPVYDQVRPPEYIGLEDAEDAEKTIAEGAQKSLQGMRFAQVLAVEYITKWQPERRKAKRLGMSQRTFRRRRDGAEFWFWCLCGSMDDL
jgi:hypothetical protein